MLSVIMLKIVHYERHYDERHYAECRGTISKQWEWISAMPRRASKGTMTFSITTLSITTLSIQTFIITIN
jgi:hypothetical protein